MFNLNRLAVQQDTPLVESVLSLGETYTDTDRHNHSFLMEALDFCKSIDNEMLESNRVFYGALCESEGNQTLINEGFSEWMSTFKKIIKKVIDFLKALLNKFLVGINMLIKREKFLKDHKKDFNKFNDNHKFHMSIYNFTFPTNVPDEQAIYDTLSSEGKLMIRVNSAGVSGAYNDLQGHLYEDKNDKGTTIKGGGDIKQGVGYDVGKAYDEYMRALSDGEYYDKVRGYLLGEDNTHIDASDFSKELFDKFRDGGSKEDKEFELKDINEAMTRFESYDKIKKDLEKKKKAAEKAYNDIAKDITKSVEVIKNGDKNTFKIKGTTIDSLDTDVARKYEYFMKARANEVNEVASIHTIAFSALLDARKDCFNQDKTILYKALYRILGNIRTGDRSEA